MLQFLLDEHLSPKIAKQLTKRQPDIKVIALADWEDGQCLSLRDEDLLALAYKHRLTLVTYDLRTITPLLKTWAEQAINHGGVVFVDNYTFAPNDFGGLVKAMEELWLSQKDMDWTNHSLFLSR